MDKLANQSGGLVCGLALLCILFCLLCLLPSSLCLGRFYQHCFFVDALPDRVRPLVLDVLDVICDYSTRSFCPDEMKRRRDFYSKHPEGMFLDRYFASFKQNRVNVRPIVLRWRKLVVIATNEGLHNEFRLFYIRYPQP